MQIWSLGLQVEQMGCKLGTNPHAALQASGLRAARQICLAAFASGWSDGSKLPVQPPLVEAAIILCPPWLMIRTCQLRASILPDLNPHSVASLSMCQTSPMPSGLSMAASDRSPWSLYSNGTKLYNPCRAQHRATRAWDVAKAGLWMMFFLPGA